MMMLTMVNYDHQHLLHKKSGNRKRQELITTMDEYCEGGEGRKVEREKDPQFFLTNINYPHFHSLHEFGESRNPFLF